MLRYSRAKLEGGRGALRSLGATFSGLRFKAVQLGEIGSFVPVGAHHKSHCEVEDDAHTDRGDERSNSSPERSHPSTLRPERRTFGNANGARPERAVRR